MQKTEKVNPMSQVKVEKVTLNIGVGEIGEGVEKAVNLLEKLTGKKAKKTTASDNAKSFGVREGLEIGAKVTLRGEDAVEFLEKALQTKENIKSKWFDTQGNFSFGIDEYFDLPHVKYDPEIGIIGFDVAVTLERKGTPTRNTKGKEMSKEYKIDREEATEFVKEKFGVEVK